MLKTLLKHLKTVKAEIDNEIVVEVFSGCPWCSSKISIVADRQLRFECGQEYVKDIGDVKWRQSGAWLDVCQHVKKTLNDRAKNARFNFHIEK